MVEQSEIRTVSDPSWRYELMPLDEGRWTRIVDTDGTNVRAFW